MDRVVYDYSATDMLVFDSNELGTFDLLVWSFDEFGRIITYRNTVVITRQVECCVTF